LAAAAGKPLVGIGSFEVALAGVEEAAAVLVTLETRRDDFYVQAFGADRTPQGEALIVGADDLARIAAAPSLLAGDAAARASIALAERGIAAEVAKAPRHGDAAVVARLAAPRFAQGGALPAAEPVYLRAPDALTAAERAARAVRLVAAAPVHGAVMSELQSRSFDEKWSIEAMSGLLSQPGVAGSVLVMTGAEVPIGYVLWRAAADEAEILSLAVDPRHRRAGHGKRLLQACLRDAARVGARTIFLEVGERNRAARVLYEHCGFVETGRRPNYYRGPKGPEDALTYRREMT
jgi:ribosomal-protein-alanine N-acetyltransferase